eukprot:gnl/TRDRNA2_/TRDRNA2_39230_c0_seq1.p1 gnl/TRDRNA2_/TRDRNA2_39230_c0~~gnl/TRDRNA2_/TRDRNA2_39230_c0_seq1.p1  ORF type:complete len:1016 (-),score=239.75 gnl/TRDRNA2_/TRDRNA2_39230_c0_seq1:95-2800(-)
MELGELGAGWPLFFEFTKLLWVLSVVLLLVQIPLIVHYSSFERLELGQVDVVEDISLPKEMIPTSYATPANAGSMGNSTNDSLLPGIIMITSSILVLVAAMHFTQRQKWVKQQVDSNEIDPNDFAVFVEGLPEDATAEREIREFFEENARSDGDTEVVKVVIGFDMAQFNEILDKSTAIKKQIDQATDPSEKRQLLQEAQEINAPLQSPTALEEHLDCTGYAVVIFRDQSEHRQCLENWDSVYESAVATLSKLITCCGAGGCYGNLTGMPLFRGEHALRVTRASNPMDILWENLTVTSRERCGFELRSYAAVAVIFLIVFGMVVGIHYLEVLAGHPSWMSFIGTIVVVVANFSIVNASKYWSNSERHRTRSERDASLVIKLAAGMLLVDIGVELALATDAKDWCLGTGLVAELNALVLANCTFVPLIIFLSLGYRIKRCIANSMYDPATTPTLTQAVYDKRLEPSEINAARAYAFVLVSFCTALFAVPVLPYSALIAIIGLPVQYCAWKRELLRYSKRPYSQSHELASHAVQFLYAGVMLYAFAGWYMVRFYMLDGSDGKWLLSIACPILVAIGAFGLVMPLQVSTALCGTCIWALIFPGVRDTSLDEDYYTAQKYWAKDQMYHTTNAVYSTAIERLFTVAVARKRPGAKLLWDPRTGQIPPPVKTTAEPAKPVEDSVTIPPVGDDSVAAAEAAKKDEEDAAADHPDAEPEKDEEPPDETAAVASIGAAALALARMKAKVPPGALEEEPAADAEHHVETVDEDEAQDEDLEQLASRAGIGLAPGLKAEVSGLTAAAALKFNGVTCTLKDYDAASDKWLVELDVEDPPPPKNQARLPAKNLTVIEGGLSPGMKVRIVGLTQAKQWNNTVGTVESWDTKVGKWVVKLFTGNSARLPAVNLEPA